MIPWRKGNHCILLAEMLIGASTVEFPQKVKKKEKNWASIWSSYSTVGIYPKDTKTQTGNDICFLMLTEA